MLDGGREEEKAEEERVFTHSEWSKWDQGRGVGRGRGGKEWEEGTGRDSKQN